MLDQRVALSPVSPTPVQPMDRLGGALGLEPGRLWVKRDDLTGLGGGGNKVRKLEYLCADALDAGMRRPRHGRRPAVEPRAHDGRGRQPPRPRLHDRARL